MSMHDLRGLHIAVYGQLPYTAVAAAPYTAVAAAVRVQFLCCRSLYNYGERCDNIIQLDVQSV